MTDIFSKLKSKYKKVNYSCEVCSSKKFDNIINYGRIAEPGQYGKLVIKSCKICGYKMLNPRFQKQFYIDYYNSIYRKIAFGDYSPSNTYLKQQVMRGTNVFNWFNKIINIKSGFMLDHGCASGSTMVPWIKNGWNSCGIDPHKPSVKLGKKNGLNIKLASGESLPFDKNIFDVVLSLGSLEHSYDIKASIQEIKRVCKKNASILAYIDYSDHYSHTDMSIKNLNFLKFSSEEWLKFNHNCHFQNRLRHHDYINIFKELHLAIKFEKPFFNNQKPNIKISTDFDASLNTTYATSGVFELII